MEKRPLTFTLFLLRLLSGITGGVAGMLLGFIVYFILLSIIPSGEEGNSLSALTIILMAFIGTLSANTVTALMVTFLDNQKYSRRKTTLLHVFLFNLILFFVTIPLYLVALQMDIVKEVAALHFLLSAFISALIMEVVAGYEYSLLGIYSVSLGIFVSICIAFFVLAAGASPLTITLGSMPAVWFILQVVGGLTELIYDNFLRYYGTDALNATTDLGGDMEVEAKDEDEDEEESNS